MLREYILLVSFPRQHSSHSLLAFSAFITVFGPQSPSLSFLDCVYLEVSCLPLSSGVSASALPVSFT